MNDYAGTVNALLLEATQHVVSMQHTMAQQAEEIERLKAVLTRRDEVVGEDRQALRLANARHTIAQQAEEIQHLQRKIERRDEALRAAGQRLMSIARAGMGKTQDT